MTLLILVAALAAQVGAPPPAPPPPVVRADRYAAFVKFSTPLAGLPDATADWMINGDAAAVRVRRPGHDDFIYPINQVHDALTLLADRRAEPLWPTILEWGGPNLELLRERRLAAARSEVAGGRTMVATTTAASGTRPKMRATMLMADELWRAGQPEAAVAMLEKARSAAPGKSGWAQAEWAMLSVRLATRRMEGGDAAGAVASLARDEAILGRNNAYTLNFQVNRAAFLVEAGRHAEALALVDAVLATFLALEDRRIGSGDEKVPGSDRQFQWIRACALKGLGRTAEADAAAAAVLAATQPTDEYFVIDSNMAIHQRLARCTDDAGLAARAFAAEARLSPVGAPVFLMLQPALRRGWIRPGFYARVREHPDFPAELRSRLRPLAPELAPALNHWRPPGAATR